jgi:hypothetical protein
VCTETCRDSDVIIMCVKFNAFVHSIKAFKYFFLATLKTYLLGLNHNLTEGTYNAKENDKSNVGIKTKDILWREI